MWSFFSIGRLPSSIPGACWSCPRTKIEEVPRWSIVDSDDGCDPGLPAGKEDAAGSASSVRSWILRSPFVAICRKDGRWRKETMKEWTMPWRRIGITNDNWGWCCDCDCGWVSPFDQTLECDFLPTRAGWSLVKSTTWNMMIWCCQIQILARRKCTYFLREEGMQTLLFAEKQTSTCLNSVLLRNHLSVK